MSVAPVLAGVLLGLVGCVDVAGVGAVDDLGLASCDSDVDCDPQLECVNRHCIPREHPLEGAIEGEGEGREGEGEGLEGEGEGSEEEGEPACADHDGDQYGDDGGCLGPDCDILDPDVHPGAAERCGNRVDDDCDGQIDDGCERPDCPPEELACGRCRFSVPGALGVLCGPTPECNPVQNGPNYARCLRTQCASGFCLDWAGFCTEDCDDDADCAQAYHGPRGNQFRCWHAPGEAGYCLPGSLTPCVTDAGCPPQESCQVSLSQDEESLLGLCQTDYRCGAPSGARCNSDITAGPLVECSNGYCVMGQCSEMCDAGNGCEYSPTGECIGGLIVASNFPDEEFTFCANRCGNDSDCSAPEQSCEIYFNLDQNALVTVCLLSGAGSGYGEYCDDEILCGKGYCFDNRCAATCRDVLDVCPVPEEYCDEFRFWLDENHTLSSNVWLCVL